MDSQAHQTGGRLPDEELSRLAGGIQGLSTDHQGCVDDAAAVVGILPEHRQQSAVFAGGVKEGSGGRGDRESPQAIDVRLDAQGLTSGVALAAGRGRLSRRARLRQRFHEPVVIIGFSKRLNPSQGLSDILIGDHRGRFRQSGGLRHGLGCTRCGRCQTLFTFGGHSRGRMLSDNNSRIQRFLLCERWSSHARQQHCDQSPASEHLHRFK